jgi:hypothetical protein
METSSISPQLILITQAYEQLIKVEKYRLKSIDNNNKVFQKNFNIGFI